MCFGVYEVYDDVSLVTESVTFWPPAELWEQEAEVPELDVAPMFGRAAAQHLRLHRAGDRWRRLGRCGQQPWRLHTMPATGERYTDDYFHLPPTQL